MREFKVLSVIRTDGGTQARAGLDEAKVTEYAERMQAGDDFPALVAFYDGTDYWLADGFHRHAAALRADKNTYLVDVKQGTRRDAVLYACGANSDHGLPRTDGDKRRAAETLLRDDEWGKWSDREIARRCKVSHPYVAKIRADLNLTGNVTSERTYTDKHGNMATMQTANIGRAGGDPGPMKRAIEANVSAAAYESIHSLQNSVLFWVHGLFLESAEPGTALPLQIETLDAMKQDHRDGRWVTLSAYLVGTGKVFRVNDLRQALNNALDGSRQQLIWQDAAEQPVATKPAASQPSKPAQELPSLADYVEGFVLAYSDPRYSIALDIPNPSHTNGGFWQAIKSSFARDGVRYKNDAELKIAIKRVFARLKNEPEPDVKYWQQFAEEDEEQPEPPVLNGEQTAEPTPDFVRITAAELTPFAALPDPAPTDMMLATNALRVNIESIPVDVRRELGQELKWWSDDDKTQMHTRTGLKREVLRHRSVLLQTIANLVLADIYELS